MNYTFKTILTPGESLHKVKGSKHYGYAFPVKDEAEIAEKLKELRKTHHSSRHVCYAWRLGADKALFRANDDGEPNNSAGMPILGQIEKYDLTNVLIAVVRYFGGTKLGVGGLIDAYRTAAQQAIGQAEVVEKHLWAHYQLHFGYELSGDIMLILRKNHWELYEPNFHEDCNVKVMLNPERLPEFEKAFQPFIDIRINFLGIY